MQSKIYYSSLLAVLLLNTLFSGAQKIDPFKYQAQKKIICNKGAVVSANALASTVGVHILKQGGNAIDAAIATQLDAAYLACSPPVYHVQ